MKKQIISQQRTTVPQGKISGVWEILPPSDFRVHQSLSSPIILQGSCFTHSDYLFGSYKHLSLQFLLWNKIWEIKRQTASNNNNYLSFHI